MNPPPVSDLPTAVQKSKLDAITGWLMPQAGRPPWRLAVLALLLCIPLVLFNVSPGPDATAFYSPMIRELGDGNFARGFHPMIPPLHMLAAAPFAAMGLDAFMASKLAASLFFALTIFPLFGIVRRFWDAQTAVWACLLFLCCSRLLRLAGAGLLDCGKTFLLALTLYALCRLWRERTAAIFMLLGLGAGGLALIRGEGVLFSALAFGCATVMLFWQRRVWREGLGLLAAMFLAGAMVVPWMLWEMRATGYPVTDSRQVGYARQAVHLLGLESQMPMPSVPVSLSERLKPLFPEAPPPERRLEPLQTQAPAVVLGEVWQGLYPLYLPLLGFGLFLAWKKRESAVERLLLLFWTVAHTITVPLLLYLSAADVVKRYVNPVIPLYLGFAAAGLLWLAARLAAWKPRLVPLVPWVLSVGALVQLARGYEELHESQGKRQEALAMRTGGEWLRSEGFRRVPVGSGSQLESTMTVFHNGRAPLVMSANYPPLTFWGRSDRLHPRETGRVLTPEDLMGVCRLLKVHFVVWDRKMGETFCPGLGVGGESAGFDSAFLPPGLVVMCDLSKLAPKEPMVILGVQENLLPDTANPVLPGK